MKIAILNLWNIDEKSIGGTERFIDDFSYSLSKKNEVDVYMFSGKNYKKNNINYISLDIFGKDVIADEYMIHDKFGDFDTEESYIKLERLLSNKIDISKYDFVHLNSHLFLKCFPNKKRIITMHSNYLEFIILWSNDAFNLMTKILKQEIKDSELKVVCPSNYYKNEWESILKEKVHVINHALNKDRLKCEINRKDLIKKYNLSINKIKILLPSRLEPIQKRPMLVLEALNKLTLDERKKFQVVFTGIDTQYEKYVIELDKFSKNNGIDSRFIKFDNINEGYKLCDIVCVPSKSESFGYSALESISLGIKSILSDIPTYNEIKDKNENVYIFKDVKDFAIILRELLNKNDFERTKVSKIWLKKYDLKDFGDKYIKIL